MESVKAPERGQGLLLDTNVLIDVLRGEKLALDWLDQHGGGAAISVITWIEVMVGCRTSQSATVGNWLEGFRRLDSAMKTATMPRGSKGAHLLGRTHPAVS
jgi:predicted nucleic acid-binding protein